jgi:hypothetical protein
MQTTDYSRIVALDYHKQVADVVGHPPTDDWAQQSAPRHRGGCNALNFGGAVTSYSIEAIDPNTCENQKTHWRPTQDNIYLVSGSCALTLH